MSKTPPLIPQIGRLHEGDHTDVLRVLQEVCDLAPLGQAGEVAAVLASAATQEAKNLQRLCSKTPSPDRKQKPPACAT